MPYYDRETGEEIIGTLERVVACYPITRDPATGAWTYSGEPSTIYDEGAEQETDEAGELLFVARGGVDVPLSRLVWRD